MDIIQTNYGLANCFSNRIEINKCFNKRPKLKEWVLKHEKKHFQSKGKFDFLIEIKDVFSFNSLKLFWFMLRHPKTWTDLSPFIKRDGEWHRDNAQCVVMICGLFLAIGGLLLI